MEIRAGTVPEEMVRRPKTEIRKNKTREPRHRRRALLHPPRDAGSVVSGSEGPKGNQQDNHGRNGQALVGPVGRYARKSWRRGSGELGERFHLGPAFHALRQRVRVEGDAGSYFCQRLPGASTRLDAGAIVKMLKRRTKAYSLSATGFIGETGSLFCFGKPPAVENLIPSVTV